MNAVYEQFPPDELMNHLWQRKENLEHLLSLKEKAKLKEPDGKLRIITNKGTTQYYQITNSNPCGKNGKYISKKQDSLIKSLAQKEYNSRISAEAKTELKHISKLISSLEKTNLQSAINSFSPERKKLIEPVTLTNEEYAARWQQEVYPKKEFAQDAPELLTSDGLRVRSKSELIIAEVLSRMNVPFRYEYPLKLKSFKVHPDFYCLNVRTRKEYAWEHFGMLDDSEYATRAVEKIRSYEQSGYSIGKNFIITMETQANPINSKQIEHLVKQYLF